MTTKFDGIQEFVATARRGSFTAAAAELGVTKSAVGRAVSRLEARLGVQLFHRTTRRLKLTSYGEAWLGYCVTAITALERGENALRLEQTTPSGQLRVDLPTLFGRLYIAPILLDLAARCPKLLLNVSFTDRKVDLIEEGIDLTIRIGQIDDTPDLVVRRLGVQRMVVCGAPDYFKVRRLPLAIADLSGHDCIAGQHEQRVFWLFKEQDGSVTRFAVPVKHEVSDYEMMLAAVVAGHGLAQLPTWMVADNIKRGQLVTVLDGMSGCKMPISILRVRTPALPAKIRIVVDEIVKSFHRFAEFAVNEVLPLDHRS